MADNGARIKHMWFDKRRESTNMTSTYLVVMVVRLWRRECQRIWMTTAINRVPARHAKGSYKSSTHSRRDLRKPKTWNDAETLHIAVDLFPEKLMKERFK